MWHPRAPLPHSHKLCCAALIPASKTTQLFSKERACSLSNTWRSPDHLLLLLRAPPLSEAAICPAYHLLSPMPRLWGCIWRRVGNNCMHAAGRASHCLDIAPIVDKMKLPWFINSRETVYNLSMEQHSSHREWGKIPNDQEDERVVAGWSFSWLEEKPTCILQLKWCHLNMQKPKYIIF